MNPVVRGVKEITADTVIQITRITSGTDTI